MMAVAWSLMQLCGIGLIGAWVLASEFSGATVPQPAEVGPSWLDADAVQFGQSEREQGSARLATGGRGRCWWN